MIDPHGESSVTESAPTDAFVVHRASGAKAQRLRREIAVMRRVAGPSVVPMLAHDDNPETGEIEVTYARMTGGSLAEWRPRHPGQIAEVFAGAAEALADLHRCDVAHGAITARSILLDDDGRAVLAGLADARAATPIEIEADLRALAITLGEILGRLPDTGPGWARRFSRPARTAQRLRAVARETQSARPTGNVDVAAFARRLSELAGEPTLSTSASPDESCSSSEMTAPGSEHDGWRDDLDDVSAPTRSWRARPARSEIIEPVRANRLALPVAATGAALVGVGAAVVVASLLAGGTDVVSTDAMLATTVEPFAESTDRDHATSPVPHNSASTNSTATSILSAEHRPAPAGTASCQGVNFNERCVAVRIGAGVVTVGPKRFAVGSPSDHLIVGDWDCDGVATLAVVRPESGEVFVFTEWRFDGPIEAELVALLDDVGPPRSVDLGNGCHDLQVRHGHEIWTLTGAAA